MIQIAKVSYRSTLIIKIYFIVNFGVINAN